MAKDGKPFHRGSMPANEDNPGIEAKAVHAVKQVNKFKKVREEF